MITSHTETAGPAGRTGDSPQVRPRVADTEPQPMTIGMAFRREPATATELDPADVTITLLGGFADAVDGIRLHDGEWRRRQAAALVKILALAAGRTLHREKVIDVLWPGLSVEEAAQRLHKAAHFSRRALRDPESVVLASDVVRLFPTRRVRVDAMQFETLAASAVAGGDRAEPRPGRCVRSHSRAPTTE